MERYRSAAIVSKIKDGRHQNAYWVSKKEQGETKLITERGGERHEEAVWRSRHYGPRSGPGHLKFSDRDDRQRRHDFSSDISSRGEIKHDE